MTGLAVSDPVAPTRAVAVPTTSPLTDLLRIAVERGTPVAELKELVALHEHMAQRQARQEFFAGLAAFQHECPPIGKNKTANVVSKKTGTRFSYTFAELPEIAKTIAPYAAKHGFSYGWDSEVTSDKIKVICTLRHAGGHAETSSLTLPTTSASAMNDQQEVGAALTFGQRRTLCSVFGLTTADEDSDANPDKNEADPTPITPEQVSHIEDVLAGKMLDVERFLRYMNAPSVVAIRAADFPKAAAALAQAKDRSKDVVTP